MVANEESEETEMRTATHARYSTSGQGEQSTEDQARVCDALAERHGFTVVARFSDKAISGGTTARARYQAMLGAARRGEVDVIVSDDASRLWRNMAEQAPRLAELRDLGVHVVTHDLDTRQESAEWMSAILGTAASAYRSEIARRTRRGLEGRAIKASDSKKRRVVINPESRWVRHREKPCGLSPTNFGTWRSVVRMTRRNV